MRPLEAGFQGNFFPSTPNGRILAEKCQKLSSPLLIICCSLSSAQSPILACCGGGVKIPPPLHARFSPFRIRRMSSVVGTRPSQLSADHHLSIKRRPALLNVVSNINQHKISSAQSSRRHEKRLLWQDSVLQGSWTSQSSRRTSSTSNL